MNSWKRLDSTLKSVAVTCLALVLTVIVGAVIGILAGGSSYAYSPEYCDVIEESLDISVTMDSTSIYYSDIVESVDTINEEYVEEEINSYTDWDHEILAIIIYQEAGGDRCSDDTRLKVGSVFMNRVESDKFPNTFEEVATARAQYGTLSSTGIKWPDRASNELESHAVERSWDIAERILNGERGFDTNDVIWQAEFVQGTEVVAFQDGIYFCR